MPTVKTAKTKKKPEVKFYEGLGRRKTSIARVRLFDAGKTAKTGKVMVNEKPFQEYFPTERLRKFVEEPLRKIKISIPIEASVKVRGGGMSAQAQAVRLGIARALKEYNPETLPELRAASYLTRDPRMKERKKPGKKGARKGQQWSKR